MEKTKTVHLSGGKLPPALSSDNPCQTVINPNPKPRMLDELDVHWWWGFWDWLMEEGWGKTSVNAPSLSDWLGHKKDIYLRDHPHLAPCDRSHTSNDEVIRELGSKEVETQ